MDGERDSETSCMQLSVYAEFGFVLSFLYFTNFSIKGQSFNVACYWKKNNMCIPVDQKRCKLNRKVFVKVFFLSTYELVHPLGF